MAACPRSSTCAFHITVEPSIVKRVRYASVFPYCKGGRHEECAIFTKMLSGAPVPRNLMPDGLIGDYMDDNVYFNSPLHFLPNLDDPWYLDQYRESHIVLCSGQGAWEDEALADLRAFERVLQAKEVPAWVDYWGYDVNHDWPWWRKQLPYFLDKLAQSQALT